MSWSNSARSWWTLPLGLGIAFQLIALLEWLAPDVIPFEAMTFWTMRGTFATAFQESILLAWPALTAGLALTIVNVPHARRLWRHLKTYGVEPGQAIIVGPGTILARSVLEEIIYRWLAFYLAIAGVVLVDWLLLGFADLHPVRWVFVQVLIPVADFATAGQLHSVFAGMPWMVAAGMLVSNRWFRNGHTYQGLIGWIWSWYMGMFLFLVMFEQGLPLAIAVHLAYNVVTMLVRWLAVGVLPMIIILR